MRWSAEAPRSQSLCAARRRPGLFPALSFRNGFDCALDAPFGPKELALGVSASSFWAVSAKRGSLRRWAHFSGLSYRGHRRGKFRANIERRIDQPLSLQPVPYCDDLSRRPNGIDARVSKAIFLTRADVPREDCNRAGIVTQKPLVSRVRGIGGLSLHRHKEATVVNVRDAHHCMLGGDLVQAHAGVGDTRQGVSFCVLHRGYEQILSRGEVVQNGRLVHLRATSDFK